MSRIDELISTYEERMREALGFGDQELADAYRGLVGILRSRREQLLLILGEALLIDAATESDG